MAGSLAVFDVVLAVVLVRALAISAWRRFPAGLLAGGAGTLLWLALGAAGWFGRGADARGMTGAWLLVFLGPSAVPTPTGRVPASAILAAHPGGARLAVAVLFAAPFALAWRRAQALSPLSDEASALKKLGLVYLVPALLVATQVVCWGLASLAPDWM